MRLTDAEREWLQVSDKSSGMRHTLISIYVHILIHIGEIVKSYMYHFFSHEGVLGLGLGFG